MSNVTPTEVLNQSTKCMLILINTVGLPIARKVTVHKAIVETDTFRNLKSLVVHYTAYQARKASATRFHGEIAIFEGWRDVTGAINTAPADSVWESFADGAFENMCSQFDKEPIVKL